MRFIVICVFTLSVLAGLSQENDLRVIFYNVENLFDTIDNEGISDGDFTPSGSKEYTSVRYRDKLSKLAMVIDSSFAGARPHLVGLCEVENKEVVFALRDAIRVPHHLKVLHFDSPDQRGIDNALLYDSIMFELLEGALTEIELGPDERPSRGILWAVLKEKYSEQCFLVAVNHWPSRYGGPEATAHKRIKAAETMAEITVSLRRSYPSLAVLVMGDFNDTPADRSLALLVNCTDPDSEPCLRSTHKHLADKSLGSHAYRGDWAMLDQILVGHKLLDGSIPWRCDEGGGELIKFDWMMYVRESDGLMYPNRTYGGSRYFGGFSDHLPVKLVLHKP